MKLESPESSTNTFENICLTITSICLSFTSCPCELYTFFTSLIMYFCAWRSQTISMYSLTSNDPDVNTSPLYTFCPFSVLRGASPVSIFVTESCSPRTTWSLATLRITHASVTFNLLLPAVAYTAHFANTSHFFTVISYLSFTRYVLFSYSDVIVIYFNLHFSVKDIVPSNGEMIAGFFGFLTSNN